jgi:protein-disulfide isomerase
MKQVPEKEETQAVEPQEVLHNSPRPALTINVQSWATPIVGLVMLVLGLLVGFYLRPLTLAQAPSSTTSSSSTDSAPAAIIPTADQTAARQALMASIIPKVRHFQGDPKAPVTVIEFGDFQCPFCGRYAADTAPQVEQQYVETGKVRFGFVNFAFLGSESTWAAEAAECASDQNKYWEYHDKLYSSQAGENQGAFNKDNLKKFAQDLGLNTQTFSDCLNSGKYSALIQSDTSLSSSLGVQSTPTFVINGQSVVGAQPFDVFQQAIDPLLK